MPSTPTTKSQVQAYRFVLRRMESALVRKDPVMLHDPMRSHKRSTIVGVIVGVVGLVGFLLFAVLKPAPTVPNSGIVIAQPSGAVYVVSQNPHELIPVFNVASGRLLLAAAAQRQQDQSGSGSNTPRSAPTVVPVTTVDDTELAGMPTGNIEGIPDGPTVLPKPGQQPTTWAVCDNIIRDNNAPDPTGHRAPQTTVVVGEPNIGSALKAGQALLVSSDGGATLNLVYGLATGANAPNDSAVRAQLDAKDPAVLHALNIADPNSYRVVSSAVLNAIPSVAEIQNPANGLDRNATPVAKLAAQELKMGESFGVQQVDGEQYYMVVPGGMEPVSQTTAQIAINENSLGQKDVPLVPPDTTTGVTTVQFGDSGGLRVNVSKYPGVRPTVISADSKPVMCLGWNADYSDPQQPLAKTKVTVGLKLAVPDDPAQPGRQMTMAQIGQAGSVGKINSFFMNPQLGGVAVRAATSAGDFDSGQIYIIDPRGVAYSVPDTFTAQVLGVADSSGTGDLPPGPQSIIGLLPLGGEPLDMQAVQHAFPGGMQIPAGAGQYIQANPGSGGN
ncbi:MAG TPA: type VII secretion protein EccB [Pseudonocardiaceae bacterium]|nr:type VII secretion protein EccB [Pseudonocardiaceae bacterium]